MEAVKIYKKILKCNYCDHEEIIDPESEYEVQQSSAFNYPILKICDACKLYTQHFTVAYDLNNALKDQNKISVLNNEVLKDIKEIFAYWQEIFNHKRSCLDNKRLKKIKAALQYGFTIEELKEAIKGCSLTPHNMGKNDRHEIYDAIDIIFRSCDQIERFIRNAKNPPEHFNGW